ncbi:RcnB family protein [Sphingomonas sp. DC1100-1]|uniref:RcnB family protein n=1 Tax=unclassified Sphingomonas TaxID=196159 RepID=UPI003CF0770A
MRLGNRETTMRSVLIATATLALTATGASAQERVVMQGPGANFPAPRAGMAPAPAIQGRGAWQPAPWQRGGYPGQPGPAPAVRPVPPQPQPQWNGPAGQPPRVQLGRSRWGSKVDGRWWGGANAPGGWRAYRRPYRGYALPSYWVSPRFYITDWQTYGLTQPTAGYNWVRYYDDAVLVDGRGAVYDTRPGINWDAYDSDYYASDDRVYADSGYDPRGYEHRDNGVGGAVAGAVVGGVAGNLIAGRGNRLGGTLIGAGVGAAAGYAIDKAEDRGRRHRRDDRGYAIPVAPDYPPPPPPQAYAPPPPPPPAYAPPPPVGYVDNGRAWRSADGVTTVTTSAGGSGYYQGGYYYPGATTTTVVVQTAPVVTTTTTTETYEDAVTYTRRARAVRRPIAAHTKTKRVWRPAPTCACQ